MCEVIEELNKASYLVDTLLQDYGVFDTQNPTKNEKQKYNLDCGRIHALLSCTSDCIESASEKLREGMKHE